MAMIKTAPAFGSPGWALLGSSFAGGGVEPGAADPGGAEACVVGVGRVVVDWELAIAKRAAKTRKRIRMAMGSEMLCSQQEKSS